jgi:hypothetical protein
VTRGGEAVAAAVFSQREGKRIRNVCLRPGKRRENSNLRVHFWLLSIDTILPLHPGLRVATAEATTPASRHD